MMKTQRLRAICCQIYQALDKCLKECLKPPDSDKENDFCANVCPLRYIKIPSTITSSTAAKTPIAPKQPQNMSTNIQPPAPAIFSKGATMPTRRHTNTPTKITTKHVRSSLSSTLLSVFGLSFSSPRNASTVTQTYSTYKAPAQYPTNNPGPTLGPREGHMCYLGTFKLKSDPHAPNRQVQWWSLPLLAVVLHVLLPATGCYVQQTDQTLRLCEYSDWLPEKHSDNSNTVSINVSVNPFVHDREDFCTSICQQHRTYRKPRAELLVLPRLVQTEEQSSCS
ncbi:hypothetical protein MAR_031526, partial [Mya arenaria]